MKDFLFAANILVGKTKFNVFLESAKCSTDNDASVKCDLCDFSDHYDLEFDKVSNYGDFKLDRHYYKNKAISWVRAACEKKWKKDIENQQKNSIAKGTSEIAKKYIDKILTDKLTNINVFLDVFTGSKIASDVFYKIYGVHPAFLSCDDDFEKHKKSKDLFWQLYLESGYKGSFIYDTKSQEELGLKNSRFCLNLNKKQTGGKKIEEKIRELKLSQKKIEQKDFKPGEKEKLKAFIEKEIKSLEDKNLSLEAANSLNKTEKGEGAHLNMKQLINYIYINFKNQSKKINSKLIEYILSFKNISAETIENYSNQLRKVLSEEQILAIKNAAEYHHDNVDIMKNSIFYINGIQSNIPNNVDAQFAQTKLILESIMKNNAIIQILKVESKLLDSGESKTKEELSKILDFDLKNFEESMGLNMQEDKKDEGVKAESIEGEEEEGADDALNQARYNNMDDIDVSGDEEGMEYLV